MMNSLLDFFIKYILPVAITLGAFFAIWIKKFLEKTADLSAEDWYKKRKENKK